MYSRSEVDKLTFTGRYGDSKPKTIAELTVKNRLIDKFCWWIKFNTKLSL